MKTLNKAQADELFQREAILIDRLDVLPVQRARELFGVEAVKCALTQTDASNGFGVGDFTLSYMYYSAYLAAVSYYNVQQLRDERRG